MKAHVLPQHHYLLTVRYPYPGGKDGMKTDQTYMYGSSPYQVADLFLRRVKSMGLDVTKFEVLNVEEIMKGEVNNEPVKDDQKDILSEEPII